MPSKTQEYEVLATLIKSAICKTRVRHRPSPALFTFPGLSGKSVWPKEVFPMAKTLEENWEVILEEYQTLKKLKSSDYGIEDHKLHEGKWDWHSYVLKGARQSDFALNCPKTVELLESFQSPRLMTKTPFSFSFFSTLHPQSTIAAHTAPCNLRVRCHLPLIVPKSGDFGLRVGEDVMKWEVGKAIFFDDAFDHEG